MKRDARVFIEDIWESIEKIERYIANISEQEFASDTEKQDAVVRRLGMRDIVIHEYFGVTVPRVWRTITLDLVELKEKISSIRRDMGA